jgi:hypothetical protein
MPEARAKEHSALINIRLPHRFVHFVVTWRSWNRSRSGLAGDLAQKVSEPHLLGIETGRLKPTMAVSYQ